MIQIASIQLGTIRSEGDPQTTDSLRRYWTTAFYKFAVAGPVNARRLGIEGDFVADTKHHGGVDKAILGYAAENYADWPSDLNESDFVASQGDSHFSQFGPGAFAENLTIAGQSEADVCVGDVFRVGPHVRLQVSQPRQPCWKISRRWQHKTLTKLVAQTGRTGWYFRVLDEGPIALGDRVELLDRPHPDWTVKRANDVLLGREVDRFAVAELMAMDELASEWKQSLG